MRSSTRTMPEASQRAPTKPGLRRSPTGMNAGRGLRSGLTEQVPGGVCRDGSSARLPRRAVAPALRWLGLQVSPFSRGFLLGRRSRMPHRALPGDWVARQGVRLVQSMAGAAGYVVRRGDPAARRVVRRGGWRSIRRRDGRATPGGAAQEHYGQHHEHRGDGHQEPPSLHSSSRRGWVARKGARSARGQRDVHTAGCHRNGGCLLDNREEPGGSCFIDANWAA